MTPVVGASVVVVDLVDSDAIGSECGRRVGVLASNALCAPHLMPIEVTSVLGKAVLSGDPSSESVSLAHANPVNFLVHLYPFRPF